MTSRFTRRTILKTSGAAATLMLPASALAQPARNGLFLLTNPTVDAMTLLDGGADALVGIAASPWGATGAVDGQAYICSAQDLTIVDVERLEVTGTLPYQTPIDGVGYGEYRSGGMGVAVTPNGKMVAAGINLNGANGVVELYDVAAGAFVAAVPVGVRPFDVAASPDSRYVYSIDHDSFTISAIELESLTVTTIDAAPLGYGEFDKPHYAAVRRDGTLLLPYVGKILWMLDPMTGESSALPMTANTHQHGIVLSADEQTAYIVGTGPAGPAPGPPSLTILNLETGAEQIIELDRPHEQVAITGDGKTAILTGGYSFAAGGWDGLTYVDLETGDISEVSLPGRPLAIRRLR